MSPRFTLLLVLSLLATTKTLHAQQEPGSEVQAPIAAEQKLSNLQSISEPLADSLQEINKLQELLATAETTDAKQEIQERLNAERERLKTLRSNFRNIVGGSEAVDYQEVTPESGTFQDQLLELAQPILSSLSDATAEPRELEALRARLEVAKERQRKANVVLTRIEELLSRATDPTTISELQSAQKIWDSRERDAASQIAILDIQVSDRLRSQQTVWEALSSGFSEFFKSRGMNLLFAILVAVAGFFITRKLYALFLRLSPVHRKGRKNFTSRISDVLAMAISILIAILGVIIVFYIRGDWLLLTIVIFFLLGLLWAGKTAIPPYLEQIRMILNLGSVREGERVIYEGLPWQVSKLGFYTTFINPRLQGGHLRIPIREVMNMISRPLAEKDVWFPAELDDWMLLSDETFGKSIIQTPDQVVLLQLGGSFKTYPTADFLSLVPENLSNGFRISATFGIDYQHQAICTTTVPQIFTTAINTILTKQYGREAIRSIQVQFAAAAASSLDYTVLADFDGSMAPKYNPLKRQIQKICVDVCNEHNWNIPFTQITIHQAPENQT